VLSAGFNARIQSSWKVVNNAVKVLYFMLAHPVISPRFEKTICSLLCEKIPFGGKLDFLLHHADIFRPTL
jgi:hypothetical protein